MKKKSLFIIGIALYLCSCSIPHWLISHKHVAINASGNGPEMVNIEEYRQSKSRFYIRQFFNSDSLQQISEQSFSVRYHGKPIKHKVYIGKRLKELASIPPMTPFSLTFKIKRQQGDTIQIIERDIPQQGDSVVINIEIPEENERLDSIDWENYFLMNQLGGLHKSVTEKDGLYYDLQFVDGICVKEFVVHPLSVENSILRGEITEDMEQIMKKEDVPKQVLLFYYHMYHYYISISNDCDLTYIKNAEQSPSQEVKIRVKFYEKVKQPYHYELPFAVIETIEAVTK